jgi:hypothetical protein
MFVTRTFTGFRPSGMLVTYSWPRIAASPSATASYKVAAGTSTVWEMPSISVIVTRHERAGIRRRYHIRFLFPILEKTNNAEWLCGDVDGFVELASRDARCPVWEAYLDCFSAMREAVAFPGSTM